MRYLFSFVFVILIVKYCFYSEEGGPHTRLYGIVMQAQQRVPDFKTSNQSKRTAQSEDLVKSIKFGAARFNRSIQVSQMKHV
uniref:Putative secreted protein n=1 Tax=Anopheles triannulatus TaxID=58253 RepID=A0A2M4B3X9_9DIPT